MKKVIVLTIGLFLSCGSNNKVTAVTIKGTEFLLRDTIEYDTLLFIDDTFYNSSNQIYKSSNRIDSIVRKGKRKNYNVLLTHKSSNRIDSIVKKGKRRSYDVLLIDTNYNVLLIDTIREDISQEKDTLWVFYDTIRLSRVLTIEYQYTREYDTDLILFTDTSYNSSNNIDSIVKKSKKTMYNILVKDTIREDTLQKKDTIGFFFYDIIRLSRVLRIEYREIIEYDRVLILFNDTFYNEIEPNRIDSIVEKTKRKNYNILVKDTIREDTLQEKDTLSSFYNNEINKIGGIKKTFSYYNNHSIMETVEYENELMHGWNTRYNPNGYISELDCYQNNNLQEITSCLNLVGTSPDTIKDLRDSLYLIYEHSGGLRHGFYTAFHENGHIKYLRYYQNGTLHKTTTFSYYNNHSIMETVEYENELKHGWHTRYNPNGYISGLDCYHNNEALFIRLCLNFVGTSPDTIKDLRDRPYIIYEHSGGLRHGFYSAYHENGNTKYLRCYQNGTLHETATRDEIDDNSFTCP